MDCLEGECVAYVCVPFTDGVAWYINVYYSQLEGSKNSFPLDEIFLAFIGF